jgi:dephospho-CoA kinase
MDIKSLFDKIKACPNKIGLTGGIASGKTTVSNLFKKQGFAIIDFDLIAAEVRNESEIQKSILNSFKTTDPKELRQIVFKNKESLALLYSIMEFRILEKALNLSLEQLKLNKSPIIWDAPTLIETGLFSLMDSTILITSLTENRFSRLTARDNIDKELAEKMIKSQHTDQEKIDTLQKHSHLIIDNDGSLRELKQTINLISNELRKKYENK